MAFAKDTRFVHVFCATLPLVELRHQRVRALGYSTVISLPLGVQLDNAQTARRSGFSAVELPQEGFSESLARAI